MAQILKFPAQASKLGYKRVRKRGRDDKEQLALFPEAGAQILDFAFGLSRFEQALLLDERGDSRAAEFYAQAIQEQDCVADAYCNLGILESQKGNRVEAFDCFTIALKHEPRHLEAHYNLGNLYFDADDFRLAQLHYEMATRLDQEFANAYFNLALAQAVTNDLAGAINTLTRYQPLVSEAEARIAEELLQNLKKSLAAAGNSRLGSGV